VTPKLRGGAAQKGRPGEVRLPAALAVVVAGVLYATLPNGFVGIARYVVPGVELVLLVPLLAANPYRMTRENAQLRTASFVLAALVALANIASFAALVHALVSGSARQGTTLLIAALQVWVTNIIAFALLFWELDRGGPVARNTADRSQLPAADFRFSQDEDHNTSSEVASRSAKVSDWRPAFVDYLYVSLTNSTAFSPTDTMPLSPRVKILMSIEATEALLVSVLVIARGVSLIK
jgi:hypothetical protein